MNNLLKNKQKILFISQFNKSISFSHVIKNFIKHFNHINNNKYEIFIYNINFFDDEKKTLQKNISNELNINIDNIFTTSNNVKNFNDLEYLKYNIYGLKDINDILSNINCDFIFILSDLWLVKILSNNINYYKKLYKYKFKLLTYVPIDIINNTKDSMDFYYDKLLLTNNVIKNDLNNIINNDFTEIVPHIIDDKFYKIDDNELINKFKSEIFGKENVNKFIIGSFNANSIRKRWDLVIEGFCKFYKTMKNSLLIIKTPILNYRNSNNHNQGFIIEKIIKKNYKKYNIKDDIIKIIIEYLPKDKLNLLYNSIDIFINASDGEGFGLIPFEAGKIEKVSILPNHSTFKSLYENQNFNFLLNTKKYPASYIRDNDELDNILSGNKYYCVYNNTISYKKSKINFSKILLPISNISTIFVSKNTSDNFESNINPVNELEMFHHVRTLDKALKILENDLIPDKVQILISSDLDIIQESYETLKKFYYDKHKNKFFRNIVSIEPDTLKNYTMISPQCNIISINGIYNKLLFYYNNPEILKDEGKRISKLITDNYNPKIIIHKLNNIINSL